MFGLKRIERALLRVEIALNTILETTMATQDQLDALTAAVNAIGETIQTVADRFKALADKLDAAPADDGDAIANLTNTLRTEASQLAAIGVSASSATPESPPTTTDSPAVGDTGGDTTAPTE